MTEAVQADLLLAELFAIQSAGETCAVMVAADGRELWLHFEDGTLVHPESPATTASLGELLVLEGKLTRERLDVLLADIAEREARGEALRLGDAAIARGFLTRKELGLALLADLRATLVEALTWEAPTFAVVPAARNPELRARFPTSIEPLVLSAFRKLPRLRLAAFVQPLVRAAPPVLLEPVEAMRALFRTRVEENEALGAVIREGGAKTLAEMVKGNRGPHDGLPFVAALAAAGSLTWPGGPPSQRSHPPPPRLVVPAAARPERVSPAAKRSAIATVAPKGHSTLRWLLSEEEERATTEPAASASTKIVAERSFHLGKAHLERGDATAAKAEFWRAHQLDPGMAEYELYLGWLTLRGDEQRAAELESIAIRAKRQAPELGFASYVLSHLALLRGDVDRAEAEQQRAARLGVREAAPLPSSIAFAAPPAAASSPTLSEGKIRAAGKRRLARRRPVGPRAPDGASPSTARYGTPPPPALDEGAAADALEPPAATLPSPRVAAALGAAPASGLDAPVTAPLRIEGVPTKTLPMRSAPIAVTPEPSVIVARTDPPPAAAPRAAAAPSPAASYAAPVVTEARDDAGSRSAPTLPPAPLARSARWPFAAAGALLAVGAFLAVRAWTSAPQRTPPADATAASATTTPSMSASTSASAEPAPAADAASPAPTSDAPDASDGDAAAPAADAALADAKDAAPARAIPRGMGEILVEGAPAGHRIFVGKHALGETPAVVLAPCGKREVKIGSRGTPRTVDIPCGGRVTLHP